MSGGRCVSCGLLVEIFATPADETLTLRLLQELKLMQRKRGFHVTRGDRDYTYCTDCVDDLIAKSEPKGKK